MKPRTNLECYQEGLKQLRELESWKEEKVIKKGKANEHLIISVLTALEKYFHIQIQECSYDYEDFSQQEWCDIEGINHGWLWLRNEDNKNKQRELLAKKIKEPINSIIKKEHFFKNAYFIHFKTEEGECIRIYNQENDATVYNYRFSNEELSIY